jgi:hypothetical protein
MERAANRKNDEAVHRATEKAHTRGGEPVSRTRLFRIAQSAVSHATTRARSTPSADDRAVLHQARVTVTLSSAATSIVWSRSAACSGLRRWAVSICGPRRCHPPYSSPCNGTQSNQVGDSPSNVTSRSWGRGAMGAAALERDEPRLSRDDHKTHRDSRGWCDTNTNKEATDPAEGRVDCG